MIITLAQFWDVLNAHDWYYHFSDDQTVYHRGTLAHQKLLEMSEQTERHSALFKAFCDHAYSGKPWGTPIAPKPEREVA